MLLTTTIHKEAVTAGGVAGTMQSNLGLTPYNATSARGDQSPQWLARDDGRACMINGRQGVMRNGTCVIQEHLIHEEEKEGEGGGEGEGEGEGSSEDKDVFSIHHLLKSKGFQPKQEDQNTTSYTHGDHTYVRSKNPNGTSDWAHHFQGNPLTNLRGKSDIAIKSYINNQHYYESRQAIKAFVNEILGGGSEWKLPPEPGTAPIPEGHVRLYHQTSEELLGRIKHHGITLSSAKGIEGPKAIYADEKGFYGKPSHKPTIEFHVPKERWDPPFVHADSVLHDSRVAPENIIAVHRPWHRTARYLEKDPKHIERTLAGDNDGLGGNEGKAVSYIKKKYGGTNKESQTMNAITPIEEAVTLRFTSPSRAQIAKQSVYWDIHRRIHGLGKVKVGPIEGSEGSWYMDVSSSMDNQFLDPSRLNNILVSGVEVTKLSTMTIPFTQVASQDYDPETSLKEDIQKLVEKTLSKKKVFSEGIDPKDFVSIGYLHQGVSTSPEKVTYHFSHPEDVTMDNLVKVHKIVSPLGYTPLGYDEKKGTAVWKKGPHHAIVSRETVTRGLHEPPHKHTLRISEPRFVEKRLRVTEEWKPEYHGRITQKGGRAIFNTGPHDSREEAVSACFKAYPNAKECSVGYGKGGGYSDIRWHRNENYNVNKPQSYGKTV